MGLSQVVKSGIVEGNKLSKVFAYCKKNNFAIPAVNVINSESINATLESAANTNSAIMIQLNYENAKLFSGKVHKGDASILGALLVSNQVHTLSSYYKVPVILTIDYVTIQNIDWLDKLLEMSVEHYKQNSIALFSSFAIDLSYESKESALKIAKKYLKKLSKIGMSLEIKIGINYANDKELSYFYEELQNISSSFMIAFSFVDEEFEDKKNIFLGLQKNIQNEFKTKSKPLNLVFDGDFCTKKEVRIIINTGVVKINLDSEIKNAFCDGINNYGKDTLLEKYMEPKQWLRETQKTIIKKLNTLIKEYNAKNSL